MAAKRGRGNPNWTAGIPSPNPSGKRARVDARRRVEGADDFNFEGFTALPRIAETGNRVDGWFNLINGIGTNGRDKRRGTKFYVEPVDWIEAEELWRGDDLAARIVETVPDEMTRERAEVQVSEDAEGSDFGGKDLAEMISARWDDLEMWRELNTALRYERAYGGAAILIGANDAQGDLTQPLDVEAVRSLDFLTTLMPHEVVPVEWYGDPRAKQFGRPMIYQLSPQAPGASVSAPMSLVGVRVHESRLIVFEGARVSHRILRGTHNGWGDSVFTRCHTVLRDFNLSWAAAGILVVDFSQAVYKMEGLVEAVQTDIAEGKSPDFSARMIAMEMGRSVARATLIDSKDSFGRETTNVSGLPDLLDRFATRLATAAGLPAALLFSDSPGGLNASGASSDQLRMHYDHVRSAQRRKLEPAIRKLTRIIMHMLGGEPDKWSIKFHPLWQPSAKEDAETRKIQSDIDVAMIQEQVLSPEDVRRCRYEGDEYSYHTTVSAEETASPADVAAFRASGGTTANPSAQAPAAPGATEIAKQAMNGAQITSLIEVVTSANSGVIARESAAAILMLGFQLSAADADKLLGPKEFQATPPPTPSPFGSPAPAAPVPPKPPAPPADLPPPDVKPADKTPEETAIGKKNPA